jgi:hypothetical protein
MTLGVMGLALAAMLAELAVLRQYPVALLPMHAEAFRASPGTLQAEPLVNHD